MKPLHLEIRKCLPIIRKAFDAGELQCQRKDKMGRHIEASYKAGCVIAQCLTAEQRERFDNHGVYTSISSLIEGGDVITDNGLALGSLQNAHDTVTRKLFGTKEYHDQLRNFEQVLKRLETENA